MAASSPTRVACQAALLSCMFIILDHIRYRSVSLVRNMSAVLAARTPTQLLVVVIPKRDTMSRVVQRVAPDLLSLACPESESSRWSSKTGVVEFRPAAAQGSNCQLPHRNRQFHPPCKLNRSRMYAV